jgi:hypothetical protein
VFLGDASAIPAPQVRQQTRWQRSRGLSLVRLLLADSLPVIDPFTRSTNDFPSVRVLAAAAIAPARVPV